MPRTQSPPNRLASATALPAAGSARARPSAPAARRTVAAEPIPPTRRLRLPSLTCLLVRGLVVLFLAVAVWRLGLLGLETYDNSRFQRPPVVTQAIAPPVAPTTDAGLAAVLARHRGLPGGTVGIYVRNLANGVGSAVNAERRFNTASLFKLPVLVEVYKQHRLRRFTWDEEMTIGREHWTDGSGVLQARVGEQIAIGELLRLMIVESDNIAANMLVDLVGVRNINETMQSLGLRDTRLVDRHRENIPQHTTPEDMGRLLEIIASGRLVDASTSEEAIRLLEKPQAQAWLADGLPTWGKLAHKWGDLPNARHDAGIIYTPRNQLVVVVMTEHSGAGAAADLIRAVSRDVVGYFEGPGP